MDCGACTEPTPDAGVDLAGPEMLGPEVSGPDVAGSEVPVDGAVDARVDGAGGQNDVATDAGGSAGGGGCECSAGGRRQASWTWVVLLALFVVAPLARSAGPLTKDSPWLQTSTSR